MLERQRKDRPDAWPAFVCFIISALALLAVAEHWI